MFLLNMNNFSVPTYKGSAEPLSSAKGRAASGDECGNESWKAACSQIRSV